MSTELQTLENLSFQEVAALTGARVQGTGIPQLRVNREPEDDNGNKLPIGVFFVEQDSTKIFGAKAVFRPFINAYQYTEYSPSENKFTNRSMIIKSFSEEALDEKGGVACGKISFKQLADCSLDEQMRQKNIKCRRLLYGLVTLEKATLADGESVVLTGLPVLWRLAGSNFMAPDTALKTITKLKHQYFQHNLELTLKREKKGATTYYNVIVEPQLKETISFSDEDFETFKMFQETINRENGYIAKAWRNTKTSSEDKDYYKELELNDGVEDL